MSNVLLATELPHQSVSGALLRTRATTATDTLVIPMGNYVSARVGNYVIRTPSDLGNYVIADSRAQR
jgi:hypothetical protein